MFLILTYFSANMWFTLIYNFLWRQNLNLFSNSRQYYHTRVTCVDHELVTLSALRGCADSFVVVCGGGWRPAARQIVRLRFSRDKYWNDQYHCIQPSTQGHTEVFRSLIFICYSRSFIVDAFCPTVKLQNCYFERPRISIYDARWSRSRCTGYPRESAFCV